MASLDVQSTGTAVVCMAMATEKDICVVGSEDGTVALQSMDFEKGELTVTTMGILCPCRKPSVPNFEKHLFCIGVQFLAATFFSSLAVSPLHIAWLKLIACCLLFSERVLLLS